MGDDDPVRGHPGLRRVELCLLVLYAIPVAFVLLVPIGSVPSTSVTWVTDQLTTAGLPADAVTEGRVEFVCNVLILVPLSALGALAWPASTWRDWAGYGFLVSFAVELVQALFLPERAATFQDVVANTAGALGGAWVVGQGRWLAARYRRRHG